MAAVLTDLPGLTAVIGGKEEPAMRQTTLGANISNLPVVAQEAPSYTGATTAEYVRGGGFSVSLMTVGTSHWTESLRGVSGRLSERLADAGYPAYLGDPVTSATLGIGQVFWGRVKKLAQRKRFPSVNWNISFSKHTSVLEPYFEKYDQEYCLRKRPSSWRPHSGRGRLAPPEAESPAFATSWNQA